MVTKQELMRMVDGEVTPALHLIDEEAAQIQYHINLADSDLQAGNTAAAKLEVDEIGRIASGKAWSDYQVSVMNDFRRKLEEWVDSGAEYYMISVKGFDTAAILEVFWGILKYTSPTELELSLQDILSTVEMNDERKRGVEGILQQMVASGLLDKHKR